ncbi:MAG: diaminopimelate decarboxylase, partial [Oscillospiraceae bacterium]
YRIAKEEGLGIDVVSAGELYTALTVGFDTSKICYHGNNKTEFELNYAIDSDVLYIVCDNIEELYTINKIGEEKNKKVNVLLRVTPGVDAHTHDFIQTGKVDSKFGFAIELGYAMEAVELALKLPNINLEGLHCHIGSQIFDIEPFTHTAEVMLDFINQVKQKTNHTFKTLNLGGGFGIKYTCKDDPVPYESYMEKVSEVVKNLCQKANIDTPFIIIEPGRSIVGNAGTTLYRVGSVKEIKGIRTYVSVDGGMTDNIRYALYEAEYEFLIANKANLKKDTVVTIAGRCCESGDLLGKDIPLQKCEKGDILASFATGAYNYSMSSNYNRVLKPAVVFVKKDGDSYIAVNRETFEDLIRNDI